VWDVSVTIGSMHGYDAGFPDGGRVCMPEGHHRAGRSVPGITPTPESPWAGVLGGGGR